MAAVSWTGGKDCALALHEATAHGLEVRLLVTFAPENPSFRAHPIPLMKAQAAAIGLPHMFLTIRPPAYDESYEAALRQLQEEYGITYLVTGDIDFIGASTTNYMNERCAAVGMDIFTPLWQRPRESLIQRLLECRFHIIFSCVKEASFPDSKAWLGRTIDATALADLRALHASRGVDVCGENGEYHTMVLGAPYFDHTLLLPPFTIESKDGLSCLRFEDATQTTVQGHAA
ncbi:PP-loop superfamily ATP-utilizing enzyme [Achlya hypogyna]|uniref:Diphthine--ammonia ligase n=1 Tax=Achlya hypogyna TaxID=1202772 RepID=A0A1V9Z7R7_ACHHY|nr:PP-loop superfamily ATP-utilizing enzyme [Achlya hypogyna]